MIKKSVSLAFAALIGLPIWIANSSGEPGPGVSMDRPRDFVIAGDDGYGTQECLKAGTECGYVIANSLCKAKGFMAALAYRELASDEITKAIPKHNAEALPAKNYLISCRD